MSEWSGVSGTHWGLIGDRFAMLIERSVAPEILHTLATRRSVEEVLDALVTRGIEQLPGFCLVGFDDTRVTAYLRGGFSLRVEASWHDALTETGTNVRTWREVSVEGVSRFAVFGPDEWHRAEVPIRSYANDRERIVLGVQGLSFAVCERLTDSEVPLMTTTTTQDAVRGTVPSRARSSAVHDDTNIFDELFSTGPSDAHDQSPIDDATVLSQRAEDTASTEEPRARYVVVLPDGVEAPLHRDMLLGRNPKDPDESGAQLIAVFDPNGNISRTHARITVTDDGVMVQDLESTNGTALVTAADEISLTPNVARLLSSGDRIILGGDAQIEFRERT